MATINVGFNCTLIDLLKSLPMKQKSSWPLQLQSVIIAYNPMPYTLWPGYFEFFKCKEFLRYMWELEISELNVSRKNLLDGHLVSNLGGCGGRERTDYNTFYYGRVWWS